MFEGALKGVQVQNLTPDLARQLGLPATRTGVVVTTVDPSSAALNAGLQPGDIVQEVNRKPVRNPNEYEQALVAGGDQPVLLLVSREGASHFVLVPQQ